jgi:hypothetical protein
VWVPRWEIDWILHWRLIHICYPIIFHKPTIGDLLDDERLKRFKQPVVKWPFPWPPPPPDHEYLKQGGMPNKITQDLLGRPLAQKLTAMASASQLGRNTQDFNEILESPAFLQHVAPPLPNEVKGMTEKSTIRAFGSKLNLDAKLADGFDPHHYIGPFMRCFTVVMPEWQAIFDVPDITFQVTQDVNGDDTQEVIYSEGFFDIRWDATSIPDVKLVASQIALAGVTCDGPEVPCATPAIVLAGKTPLHNPPLPEKPFMNTATGYAVRTNRPHPTGDFVAVATGETALTPFCGTFPFYGCNHAPGAVYYRLVYQFKPPGSASFTTSSPVPFLGFTWPLYRWVGVPGHLEMLNVAPDSLGWYPILNDADGWLPAHLLLEWPSGSFQNGMYQVVMQFANAAKNPLLAATTPQVLLRVDNSYPNGVTSYYSGLDWRVVGESWHHLGPSDLVCPVMTRPIGKDLEFLVSYQASHPHYRSLYLTATGCGGGNMDLTSAPITAYKWHSNATMTSDSGTANFLLTHDKPQGGYAFHLRVDSRAFNPDDNNTFIAKGYADPRYIWAHFDLQIAIVDV